jgi:hypothetical protein
MEHIKYGRRIFSFGDGDAVLKSTSVTEKAMPGEDEMAFTRRLLRKFEGQRGTIEVVFKSGRPDYAIIIFD